ncbi:hypothetical protein [Myroides marinus]|uniref:hypothetical protein n=3 Tax=Myroides marinus TaxID=703342 RepID=UPI0025767A1F|nr:hypothetical protein [Myroides marinus]MDM1375280.1 hypothetical protein [Myroides marinus]MDM1382472.1 hypothetical protein [Myroides marinus]
MKIIHSILICLFAVTSFAQIRKDSEKIKKEELLYSERTIDKLKHIVDSLNSSFLNCELTPTYYPIPQTIGTSIHYEGEDLSNIVNDLKNNISISELKVKYPSVDIQENTLLALSTPINKEDKKYSYHTLYTKYNFTISTETPLKKDTWYINEDDDSEGLLLVSEEDSDSLKYLSAFYYSNNSSKKLLPQKYAQMIAYTDCMIDTTTTKFKENATYTMMDVYLPKNWKSLSLKKQKKLLDEMRSNLVIGSCSMDESPNVQAKNIAILAAETNNWKIFLKAHLDILNDNFERVAWSNMAEAYRQTYIQELETLNINTIDLILGTVFLYDNPAKNHYFGNIYRLSRAISEAQKQQEFEREILEIIEDNELDTLNRLRFTYLYLNYISYLEDTSIKNKKQKEFLERINTSLPNYYDFIKKSIYNNNEV